MSTQIITVIEAAAYLRISPCALYKLLRQRRIAHVRVGRGYRLTIEDLDAYLAEATVPALSAPRPSSTGETPHPETRTITTRTIIRR